MSQPGRAGAYSGLPTWIFLPAAVGAVFVVLPLVAMSTRVPWAQFFDLVTSESSLAALRLSLRTSAASTLLCLVLESRWPWCWLARPSPDSGCSGR